jgi:hypothetical protein
MAGDGGPDEESGTAMLNSSRLIPRIFHQSWTVLALKATLIHRRSKHKATAPLARR